MTFRHAWIRLNMLCLNRAIPIVGLQWGGRVNKESFLVSGWGGTASPQRGNAWRVEIGNPLAQPRPGHSVLQAKQQLLQGFPEPQCCCGNLYSSKTPIQSVSTKDFEGLYALAHMPPMKPLVSAHLHLWLLCHPGLQRSPFPFYIHKQPTIVVCWISMKSKLPDQHWGQLSRINQCMNVQVH